jgi:ABC-type branched-subunit amino acid transport system permease subunit
VIVRALWILAALGALTLAVVTRNTYYLYLGATVAIMVVVASGLNVLAGLSGQISLGHAGFFAIGAYAGAILATRVGLSLLPALALGAIVTAAVGAALALAALRVSGPYLAMVTIAFGIIVEHGLIEWDALTRGFGGIADIPRASLGPITLGLGGYYYVVLAATLASLLAARNLGRSRWGRALVAVRESDVAAESLGLNAYWVRTVAFTVGAVFAAIGGVLYAFLAGFVSPDSFTMQTSILFLLVILFGGLGRVLPVAGHARASRPTGCPRRRPTAVRGGPSRARSRRLRPITRHPRRRSWPSAWRCASAASRPSVASISSSSPGRCTGSSARTAPARRRC